MRPDDARLQARRLREESLHLREKARDLTQQIEALSRATTEQLAAHQRDRSRWTTQQVELKQSLADETQTREALLFLLEDLEENRRALERAHREWLASVDAIAHPIMVHDADLRILRVNRAYAERAGLTYAELVGRPYWECFPKRDGPFAACVHAVAPEGASDDVPLEEFTIESGEIFVSRAFTVRDREGRLEYVLHILEDVTRQRHAERALQKLNRALLTLSRCNEALVRIEDEQLLLEEMCRIAVEVGGYRSVWVGFAEHDDAKSIRSAAREAGMTSFVAPGRVTWADEPLGRGPAGTAIREMKPQLVRDTWTDATFGPWREEARTLGFRSVLALPLANGASAYGVLVIRSSEPDAFDEAEIKLLSELAGDLSLGILTARLRVDHARTALQLQRSMEATIQSIAVTVEMRDSYTAGHSRRVADLASAIATELKLPQENVRGIHLAAIVHDIGKVSIPSEILCKTTKLTEIEFEIIKAHPQDGYDILRHIDFPWPIAEMVRQHHERLDGSGYPQGLEGDAILPGAKILAIADVVEAMGSARPYRPVVGIDAALDEIVKHRGTRYDADAVDACVRLFREQRFAFDS